jgi:DUF4097 and DUF4098 domain-containing protein YvlB
MKKFLEDLKKELNKCSIVEDEIQDILEDHEDMIKEAINEGLNEEDITTKFGNPKDLAKELAKSSKKTIVSTNETGYNLIESFHDCNLKMTDLSTVADDLIVETHDKDSIEIYMRKIKDTSDYDISCFGEKLKVNYRKQKVGFFSSINRTGTVLIKLPQSIQLEDSKITTVSGDCILKVIKSKKLVISSTSGNIEMNAIVADKFIVKTVSGDIEIEDLDTGKAQLTAVSGNYKVWNSTVKSDLDMNTVSGDFTITNVECDKTFYSAVSGDIEAEEFYPNEISCKSISGDITITNADKERKISVIRKKSLSGEIKIK